MEKTEAHHSDQTEVQSAYTAVNTATPDLRRDRIVEIRVSEIAPISVQAVDVDDFVESGKLIDVRVALQRQVDQAEVAVLLEVAVEFVRDDGVLPRGVDDPNKISVPIHVRVSNLGKGNSRQMNASTLIFLGYSTSEEKFRDYCIVL